MHYTVYFILKNVLCLPAYVRGKGSWNEHNPTYKAGNTIHGRKTIQTVNKQSQNNAIAPIHIIVWCNKTKKRQFTTCL